MKESPPKSSPSEEEMDAGYMERVEIVPGRSKNRRQRPKREGCVSVSLRGNSMTSLAGSQTTELAEEKFVKAVLAGDASTFLAGKTTTTLAGGAITSLAGYPGTSLLILTKKEIPQGAVIKKADLEAYVVSEPVIGLDESISKEIPVGRIAEDALPAHSLVASVVLAGTSSTSVSVIKLPAGALVYRTKKTIPKGTVIQETDIEPYVISSPIKSLDMYDSPEDLVGKVAKENIKEDKILKKYMVK